MERILNQLVEKLKKAYGDRLVSVVLYGSAAVGDHHGRFSDLNLFCALKRITPEELREAEPIFRWWRELGNPSPLMMSEHEVASSTDCFPIEFHDIQARNRILFGADIISGLKIDYSFYRAQVEHELRAKLLRLRQKAGGVVSDKQLLLNLLMDSVSTFATLFRHALLLAGFEAKWHKRDVFEGAAERFAIDAAPFYTLLDLREEKMKPRDAEAFLLFGSYLKQVETVIDAVDLLER
jgi:predicted nucleotidyltransferase